MAITAACIEPSIPASTNVVSYLRVSTGRQAESDLSIPDQRRQIEGYCAARGWTIVEDYVEPGSSAMDDRRPAFQTMIDAALVKSPAFSVILVHSFSRFFRDQFQFERYVRKLAKNGVQIVSITQDMGDSSMGTMLRQIVTLFDEYQSKENAKHTLRAMCENARQGYWNGARPPIGYRIVTADKRGDRTRKTLEIDPLHADTIRLIYRLALDGIDGEGPMGLRGIARHLNGHNIRTREGGRWGLGSIHDILTRTTYFGQHRFNRRDHRTRTLKPEAEHAVMAVPPLIAEEDFLEVQQLLRSRSPKVMPPRIASGSNLLTGICFCGLCGGGMMLRTGVGSNGRGYRYYACSTRARQGASACKGVSVRMDRLDEAAIDFLRSELLTPGRLKKFVRPALAYQESWTARRQHHIDELSGRAADAERRLRNLYDAVENGTLTSLDRMFKERVSELSAMREQAEMDADRAARMVDRIGHVFSIEDVLGWAKETRSKLRGNSFPRHHVRSLLQRIEVRDKHEAYVRGSRSALLLALASAGGARMAKAKVGESNDAEEAYAFLFTL